MRKPKGHQPNDPEFAALMRAQENERRIARDSDNAAFRLAYAERLSKPLPAAAPSSLHQHDEACREPGTAIDKGIRLNVIRCVKTGHVIEEVR